MASQALEHDKASFTSSEKHDTGLDPTDRERQSYDENHAPGGGAIVKPVAASAPVNEGLATHDVDVEKRAVTVGQDGTSDPDVVGWDGDDDPQNPMNWPTWRTYSTIVIVSCLCFITPLASSMFAPGVPQLMREFESNNNELASFVVSVYVLGFALGPLVLAPCSELYGRTIVYNVSNVLFFIFTIACAVSSNLTMLIVFRFFAGCFGAAVLTIGGGTIADLIPQDKRAAAMSAFVLGPVAGPVIGPVAGGYLTQARGWRWVFWVLVILSGVLTVACLVFLRETYAVTILDRKAKRLRKETGNMALRSKLASKLSVRDQFLVAIVRPTKMLFLQPIVMAVSLYVGVVYGYMYLLFTTFTPVFEQQYGFSSGSVGLTYMGLGIGSILGVGIFGYSSQLVLKKKGTVQADGTVTMLAEWRIPPMIPGTILIPIGLFLYGWTSYYRVHWIVPIIGTSLVGIGNLAVFMSVSLYLIDAYTSYAASALAANTVVRSILGAVLPLAGPAMYQSLGLGWGNSLLAFIAVAMVPVPLVMFKYGPMLRDRFPLS